MRKSKLNREGQRLRSLPLFYFSIESPSAATNSLGCDQHWSADMKNDTLIVELSASQISKFWTNVAISEGCWKWQSRLSTGGYGRFRVNGKELAAHRIAFFAAGNDLVDGFVIDHLCRNRSCVNPEHLESVTQQENVRRGDIYKGSDTHCSRGHEFTPENSILSKSRRVCRECHRIYHRSYQRKLRMDAGYEPREQSNPRPRSGSARFIGPKRLPHGSLTGYTAYKCRCNECREAYNVYHRDYRARKNLITS